MTRHCASANPVHPAVHPGRSTRSGAGFTLLEVMISMLILSFAMLGVGAALIKSLSFAGDSDNRSQAIYLAEAQLTRFQAMRTNDIGLTGCAPPTGCQDAAPLVLAKDTVDPSLAPNAAGVGELVNYNRSWTIEQDGGVAVPPPGWPPPGSAGLGIRRISVTVTWGGTTVDNSVTLVGFK